MAEIRDGHDVQCVVAVRFRLFRGAWKSVTSRSSLAALAAILSDYAHQTCAVCAVLAAVPGAIIPVLRSQDLCCVVIVSAGIGWSCLDVAIQVRRPLV